MIENKLIVNNNEKYMILTIITYMLNNYKNFTSEEIKTLNNIKDKIYKLQ